MAKIGLDNFLYAELTETGSTYTYGTAKKPAKAISFNVEITNNDVSLYADDQLAESDTSFQRGTATMGIDDEDQATMADFLGHSIDETTHAMTRNANDIAPYMGVGRVVTKMVGGVRKYKAEVLAKVKFQEPSQEDQTKGETIAFQTTTIQGNIACLENGDWSWSNTCDTKADAVTFIRTCLKQTNTQTNL